MGKGRWHYNNLITSADMLEVSSAPSGFVGVPVASATGSATLAVTGSYLGAADRVYTVQIDSVSAGVSVGEATFSYTRSDQTGWVRSGVATSASAIALDSGLLIAFTAGSGDDFALEDQWTFVARRPRGKSNLLDQYIGTDWRATGCADESITIDLGSSQHVTSVIVGGHNLTSGATVTLKGSQWAAPGKVWVDEGAVSAANYTASANCGGGVFLLADANNHIWRSTNHGDTWTDLGAITATALADMVYVGSGVVLGVTQRNIWRSTNSGETWADLGAVITNTWYGTSFADLGGGVVLVDAEPQSGDPYDSSHIWKSTDSGATWSDLGESLGSNVILVDLSACGSGTGICFAHVSEFGIVYKTTDYGETWSSVDEIAGYQTGNLDNYFGVYYLDAGIVLCRCYVYSLSKYYLLRSSDYGVTWENLGEFYGGGPIYYAGDGVAINIAPTNGTVYRSADYGQNWASAGVALGTSALQVPGPYAAGAIVVGGADKHVWRSPSPIWASPDYSTTITYSATNLAKYIDQTYRSWRISFADASNPDGYIKVSELYLGTYFEPSRNFAFDGGMNFTPTSYGEDIQAGSVPAGRYVQARGQTFSLGYQALPTADLNSIVSMWQACHDTTTRRGVPLWFTPDSASPGATYYGQLSDSLDYHAVHPAGTFWQLSLTFTELPKG